MNNYKPRAMNFELTTACPLNCPQCYCTLEGGKHIELDHAKRILAEASGLGVKNIHLSGGETLCYPHLYELISAAKHYGINADVAISGYKFNDEVFNKLVESGVSGIYVSLNGSTEEINKLTREGYKLAIEALSVLKKGDYEKSYINWVMHSNNANDFANVLEIAEKYCIRNLVVLSFKPDSSHQLKSYPSGKQIREIANFIKNYRGPVQIMVETCFSPLLAVIKDTKLFGNLNTGVYKGCGAGRWSLNVNVDGFFSPCRHLDLFENFDSINEYWEKSKVLEKLREIEKDVRKPCSDCRYSPYCRHCQAINSKLHSDLYIGHELCELHM